MTSISAGVTFDAPAGYGQSAIGGDQKHATWQQSVFTADMCESLVRGHENVYGDYAAEMAAGLEEMLSRNFSDECRTGVIQMIHALQRAESIFRRMQQYVSWRIPFHLARIVDTICKQLHSSSVGDVHVFPFYCQRHSLMVIHHQRSNTFAAAVINVAPLSTEYLPFSSERPPKLLMQTVLELKDVPKARIASEAFWATCLLAEEASDEAMYTHLIPWLNQKTLAENIAETQPCFSTGSKTPSGNLWKSFIHALKFVMRSAGASKPETKMVRVLLKGRLLRSVRADLEEEEDIAHSTKLIITSALHNAAMSLSRNAKNVPEADFAGMRKLIDDVHAKIDTLPCPDRAVTKPPPELNLKDGWDKLQMPNVFPMCECFRRLEDVEAFIGVAVEQPRVVPINFLKLPESVSTFAEALHVLDETVRLCTRMATQLSVVKNGAQLVLSLVTNVFLSILPTPVGPLATAGKRKQEPGTKAEAETMEPRRCLWAEAGGDIRYGQQLQCIRYLWQLVEFFMWASFSATTTREFDSQRIVTLGAIVAVADAVLRHEAKDHPSIVSRHMRGCARKAPFAPSVGKLATQTENSVTTMPHVAERRCAVLDYFEEVHDNIPTSNALWQWENGWDFCKGTQLLMAQMCRLEGMAVNPTMKFFVNMSQETRDASGVSNIFGQYWTELRYFRDIVLCYKWVMAPRSRLPSVCYPPGSYLDEVYNSPTFSAYTANRKLASEYLNVTVLAKATVLRYPSMTIPSRFTSPFDGTTEDDILHVKNLPSFDDALGQRDSELLLSYLTAPYIRLPLVLSFFATEDRVSCLGNTTVRNILESVVFEPGKFLLAQHHGTVPQQVPSEQPELLATPMGYLANELQFSPDGVMDPLMRLVSLAREMDAGTVHNQSVVEIILFLVRLVARVESYAAHLLHLYDAPVRRDAARGVVMSDEDAHTLRDRHRELWRMILEEFVPMMETWNVEAMSKVLDGQEERVNQATNLSALLHGHMLLLLRNVPMEYVNQETASMVLSSILFLTARHTFNTDSLDGIPETEVFDVMQVLRHRLAQYMYRCSPTTVAYVLNSAVRVTTSTGARVAQATYPWGLVAGEDCVGRFTRIDPETLRRDGHDSKRPQLEAGMREAFHGDALLAPDAVCINEGLQDVEINVNTLLLTFNASHLVALPSEVAMFADVRTVFAKKGEGTHKLVSMQCAIVQDAENRMWVRLVGQEHDIQYWKTADPRIALPGDGMRFFPDDLTAAEDWVFELAEPVRRAFFQRSYWEPPIFFLLPEEPLTADQHVCHISAVCSKTGKKLKEVVVFRDYRCTHIYDILSIGRRMYRTLIYSSDCHFSLRELQPEVSARRHMWKPWHRHAAGYVDVDNYGEWGPSVVILRHASHPNNVARCTETFIPKRLLWGLVPDALLDTHLFWQDADDNIRGYPIEDNATHILWCHWRDAEYEPIGGDRQTCFRVIRFARKAEAPKASEKAVLKSQKAQATDEADDELERMRTNTSVMDEDEEAEMEMEGMYRESSTVHNGGPAATVDDCNMMLLDLMHARKGTPLFSIAAVLGRIELLSHVLCWTTNVEYEQLNQEGKPTGSKDLTIDLVTLPRLKLQFSVKADADGNVQLYSLDHAHLFVSNQRQQLVCSLLQGIPHSVVLSDANGSISILVPALQVFRPHIDTAPFSTELVLSRSNRDWYQKLDTRYYLYPVHVSMSFVFTPTLASALYLLALRYLHCEYEEVFKLASTIGTDVEFTSEEKQNFGLLRNADRRPEAFACRCKIGLLVADSPVVQHWYLPEEVASMIACSPAISVACRLTGPEEQRLLHICEMLMAKMEIIHETAKAAREDVIDTIISRFSNGESLMEVSSSERKQIKSFFNKARTKMSERLNVRVVKDEVMRLLMLWHGVLDRQNDFSEYFKCLLDNRKAFLSAEAKAIASGEPEEAIYRVPKAGTDDNWRFWGKFDALSVKVPGAQQKLKNEEGRAMSLSSIIDYFYCGESVRKPGTCRCRDCDETCGTDDGCPCPNCERFNKQNLAKLRYIPEELSTTTMRIMSFYDVFHWVSEVTEGEKRAMDHRKSSRLPKEMHCTEPLCRKYTLRESTGSFLQCYECLTGTTKVRIGSADSAADLVTLLFPLYQEARNETSALGHLMHYMLANQGVWPKLVKYKRPQGKTSQEQRMLEIYSSIMQQAATTCRFPPDAPVPAERDVETKAMIVPRPVTRKDTTIPLLATRVLPNVADTDNSCRTWAAVDASFLQTAAGERVDLTDETREELRSWLLSAVVPKEGLLGFFSKEELGVAKVSGDLPFDLKKHPAAATSVAASMIRRLEVDMEDFAEQQNGNRAPRILGMAGDQQVRDTVASPEATTALLARLASLQADLAKLREKDSTYFITAFTVAERTANAMPVGGGNRSEALMHLRRTARQEATLSLAYLISCLCSETAETDWRQLNPFLTADTCRNLVSLLTGALLRANRIGHINRTSESAKELAGLLQKADIYRGSEEHAGHLSALVASAQQKADSLAGLLASKRVYIEKDFTFDPRFLLFEYNWNLVLRSRQRELITEMYGSITKDQSIVKQMIMGAGKTTVVGPLLALMLADGKQLVIQVVPPALLDFTRSVLRTTFSCVLQKQIFCFACDRATEVDSEVISKFHHAQQSRGIVVTTPSTIKSIYLKLVEGMDRLEDTTRPPIPGLETEVADLHQVLKIWREAVLIMDEVDMLLHPLKSELNFPIGAKHDIDFAPLRWKLPMHLLDAVFYPQTRRVSVGVKETPEMTAVLAVIADGLMEGIRLNALQGTPHTTLLNLEFYAEHMMLPFAKWLMLFLKANHFSGLTEEEALLYLTKRPSKKTNPALNEKIATLEPDYVRTLNLGYEWITAFLPHVLQKIDRVSFGIMNADDMKRAREEHPNMPRSRFVTAIPFVGKDLPSQSSEFAHPDVVIGLTILAYRYEGMRQSDFTEIMRQVHAAVEKEVGRFNQRRTTIMYNRWVAAAGGKLLQNFTYNENKKEATNPDDEIGMQPSESLVFTGTEEHHEVIGVLPLKLMKQANKDETEKLYKLFKRAPEVIHWYLNETVFPEFMRHQQLKLSASGQELGGDIIFKRRIGFSGTPSDLLPVELGTCEYERGTDGKLVHTLTSPAVMTHTLVEPGWTVRVVLDHIATASPPFHALIDTGALITGMSNLQVAQYLLKHGLPQMEGVVFLDELDRKMILVKATGRVLKLAECGIPKVKRFAFYDQVHTTGMDIEHTPNAMAVQTLGKDMTFRDFAQGAYRMRGIGIGQTVNVMIIPEVYELMRRNLETIRTEEARTNVTVLRDVTAWLLLNSIRSEHTQHNQLCLQTIGNVWRKEAFQHLVRGVERGDFAVGGTIGEDTVKALGVYRERVDYDVPQDVPQPRMFSEAIQALIDDHEPFIVEGRGKDVVERISEQARREDEIDNPVIDVQMVQEQEEERESEQEKDKEQQIEMEKFVDLTYSRDDESPTPWALASLRDPARAVQFYKLSQFHLHKRRPIDFPDNLLVSRNFFNPMWAGYRRIKNVIISMEWVPSAAAVAEMDQPCHDFGAVDTARAMEALEATLAMVRSHEGALSIDVLRDFVTVALGTPAEAKAVDWPAEFNARQLLESGDAQVERVLRLLISNFLRHEESGRHTVALALCEAETVRRVIHVRRQRRESLVHGFDTEVRLRMVPSSNAALDSTPNFVEARTAYFRQRNYQCLRFFDGDLHYADGEVNLLLRALHTTQERLRQTFFLQVIACRRRARQRWERSPVALLFDLKDPFTLLRQKTLGLCMRRDLLRRDFHFGDAFIAMNTSHTGVLSPDEVWGALRFCSLDVTAADVLDLIQVADTHHEGTLQYPDFIAMLTGKSDIEDDDDTAPGTDAAAKHLPTVEPYGVDELRQLRQERETERRRLEADANEAVAAEHRQIRDELEAEKIKEELALLQTSENPVLGETNLTYKLRSQELPILAKYFGTVVKAQQDDDCEERVHVGLNSDSGLQLQMRSVKLISDDPILKRYALTCEFRLPNPMTSRNKTTKMQLLQILEDESTLPLFAFETNVWEFTPQKRRLDRFDADEAEDEDNQRGRRNDSDDDDDSYYDSDEDDYDEDEWDEEAGGDLRYVFKKPDTAPENRAHRVRRGCRLEEEVGKRINTTTSGSSLEWMRVVKPVEGWVVFEENSRRHWCRERVQLVLNKGVLTANSTFESEHDLNLMVPPAVFDQPKNEDDDELFDYFARWNIDLSDDDGDEEDEDDDADFDMGDLVDLVGALRKAKELSVGDKVTRNEKDWDRGDEDGGKGAVGRVLKVSSSEAQVQWPNGHKGSYAWGKNGKFDLTKVAGADEDDAGGREVNNDPDACRRLLRTQNPTAKCTSCSTGLSLGDNAGFYKCNQCSANLCKKCFRAQKHEEHEFSDVNTLVEELRVLQVIAGSTVRIRPDLKAPRLGWNDAPRDGSTGVVSYIEDDEKISVLFNDIHWAGYMDEVVVVNPKYESYLTTWIGTLLAVTDADREDMTALSVTVDEAVTPPVIEGKFKVGDRIIMDGRREMGEVRAALPMQRYAVAAQRSGMMTMDEDSLRLNPFLVGGRVRLLSRESYQWNPPANVMPGMIAEIQDFDPRCNMWVTVRDGVRVTRFRVGMRDVEPVGKGRWFWKPRPGAEATEDEKARIEAADPILMPNSAQLIVERGFSDGVTNVDIFLRDTTYRARFDDLTLRDIKTNDLVGELSRDPPEPWQEHKSVRFDDGKWHVVSLVVGDIVQAFCDGKEIAVFADELAQEPDDDTDEDMDSSDSDAPEVQAQVAADSSDAEPEDGDSECDSSDDEKADGDGEGKAEEGEEKAEVAEEKAEGDEEDSDIDSEDTTDEEATPADQCLSSSGEDKEDQEEASAPETPKPEVQAAPPKHVDPVAAVVLPSESEPKTEKDTTEEDKPKTSDDEGKSDDDEDDGSSSSSSSSGSDSSQAAEAKLLKKRIKRTAAQAMALDVRNTVYVLPFASDSTGWRNKYSQALPARQVAQVDLSWDKSTEEALEAHHTRLFETAIETTKWKCEECSTENSRLLEQCTQCRGDRFRSDAANDKKAKVRAVTAWSKEAQEVRRKLHAKLRARYQKQLEQFDDLNAML